MGLDHTSIGLESIAHDTRDVYVQLRAVSDQLTQIGNTLSLEGISRDTAALIDQLSPGVISNHQSLNGFTGYPSQQGMSVALEAMSSLKLGVIRAALVALVTSILTLIGWAINKLINYMNDRQTKERVARAKRKSRIVEAAARTEETASAAPTGWQQDPNFVQAKSDFDDTIVVLLNDLARGDYKTVLGEILVGRQKSVISFLNEHITANTTAIWETTRDLANSKLLGDYMVGIEKTEASLQELLNNIATDVSLCEKAQFAGDLANPRVPLSQRLGNVLSKIDAASGQMLDVDLRTYTESYALRPMLDSALLNTADFSDHDAKTSLQATQKQITRLKSDIETMIAHRSINAAYLLLEMVNEVNRLVGMLNQAVQIVARCYGTVMRAENGFETLLKAHYNAIKVSGIDLSGTGPFERATREFFTEYKRYMQ